MQAAVDLHNSPVRQQTAQPSLVSEKSALVSKITTNINIFSQQKCFSCKLGNFFLRQHIHTSAYQEFYDLKNARKFAKLVKN